MRIFFSRITRYLPELSEDLRQGVDAAIKYTDPAQI
jgi:hypothetical protein